MSMQTALAVNAFLNLVFWIILARVLLSWFVRDPSNPLTRFLGTLTDPLLQPLSRVFTFGGLDFSPMILLFGLRMVQRLILQSAIGA